MFRNKHDNRAYVYTGVAVMIVFISSLFIKVVPKTFLNTVNEAKVLNERVQSSWVQQYLINNLNCGQTITKLSGTCPRYIDFVLDRTDGTTSTIAKYTSDSEMQSRTATDPFNPYYTRVSCQPCSEKDTCSPGYYWLMVEFVPRDGNGNPIKNGAALEWQKVTPYFDLGNPILLNCPFS